MPPPDDLDCLSHAELKSLVVKQWEQMVELRRLVAALRDEIARLKGGLGRPNLKPSGMERGTEPKPPGISSGRKRPRGSTRSGGVPWPVRGNGNRPGDRKLLRIDRPGPGGGRGKP
jgi:hypothetical protein